MADLKKDLDLKFSGITDQIKAISDQISTLMKSIDSAEQKNASWGSSNEELARTIENIASAIDSVKTKLANLDLGKLSNIKISKINTNVSQKELQNIVTLLDEVKSSLSSVDESGNFTSITQSIQNLTKSFENFSTAFTNTFGQFNTSGVATQMQQTTTAAQSMNNAIQDTNKASTSDIVEKYFEHISQASADAAKSTTGLDKILKETKNDATGAYKAVKEIGSNQTTVIGTTYNKKTGALENIDSQPIITNYKALIKEVETLDEKIYKLYEHIKQTEAVGGDTTANNDLLESWITEREEKYRQLEKIESEAFNFDAANVEISKNIDLINQKIAKDKEDQANKKKSVQVNKQAADESTKAAQKALEAAQLAQFKIDYTEQDSILTGYENSLKTLSDVSDDTKNKVANLRTALDGLKDTGDTQGLKKVTKQIAELKSSFSNISTYQNFKNTVEGMHKELDSLSTTSNLDTKVSSYAVKLAEIKTKLTELDGILKKIKTQGGVDAITDKEKSDVKEITKDIQKLFKEINNDAYNKKSSKGEALDVESMDAAIEKLKADGYSITGIFGKNAVNGIRKVTAEIKNEDGTVTKLTLTYDELAKVIRKSTDVKPVKSLNQSIASFISQFAQYYLTIYSIIGYMKEGFEAVQELDAAFIEMKKVSDESTASLQAFSDASFDLASSLGTTAVSIQESTADWMRLGKSLDEAVEMAKDTQILMNVSEFDNIEDATDALISMTQAYDDLEAMDIINKVNNVGNNFAISTDEASTALQKSASSLVTAGNSIDEALALITTANTVVQDSDSVANALKVVSMRITGTSTKTLASDLETLGEDTDSLITTVSKLQSTIKSLTAINGSEGIDILDEKGNYKSTYQILQEIANIWDALSEADEAEGLNRTNALLETLAGKQRANTLAAILQNAELLQSVYESSVNSEGSAEKENAEYLEGYEAKLNQLTTAVQEFWYTFLDNDQTKAFIDLLTQLMQTITDITKSIGSIPVALTAITSVVGLKNVLKIFEEAESFSKGVKKINEGLTKLSTKFSTIWKSITAFASANTAAAVAIGAVAAAVAAVAIGIKVYQNDTEKLAENAQTASEEFSNTVSTIDEYKSKIESLKETIHKESSSIEEVAQARVELMSIQNELIENYGSLTDAMGSTETAIKAITEATDANTESTEANLDTLKELSWQETKNQLYENEGWWKKLWDGTNSPDELMEQIRDQWENKSIENVMDIVGSGYESETIDEVNKISEYLKESGADVTASLKTEAGVISMTMSGAADDVYNAILNLQDAADNLNLSDGMQNLLSNQASYLQDFTDSYSDLIDQSTKYDIILGSDYETYYNDLESYYSSYQKAVENGETETAEQAQKSWMETYQALQKGFANDPNYDAVIDYFEGLYPTLTEEFKKWQFELNFVPSTGTYQHIKDMFSSRGSLNGVSSERLIEYANATENGGESSLLVGEQVQNFEALKSVADSAGISVETLINLLQEMGIIGSEAEILLQEKLDGFGHSINELSDEDLALALTIPTSTYNSWDQLLEKIKDLKSQSDNVDFDDIFDFEDAEGNATAIGNISTEIDSLQASYKALYDAMDEYNNEGGITIDSLQKILDLGDNWLDYLVDENGALKLDKESLKELTISRLADMEAQIEQNIIDNVSKITTDAEANEYLATTNYAVAESSNVATEALLQQARAALALAQAETPGALSDESVEAVMAKAQSDIAKVQKLFSKVSTSYESLSGDTSSSSSSSKSASEEYDEFFDFFEHRVDQFSSSLEYLENSLENVNGAFAKNQLLNGEGTLNSELLTEYGDALEMYQEKADELLQRIPEEMREAVKNGSVYVGEFIGDEGKEVKEAIDDYKEYADKVWECKQNIAELKETLRDLELDKFNNIVQDFTDQIDLLSDSVDLLDKQISLLEESGEVVGEGYYTAQIEQTEKELAKYEEEKDKLEAQLESALSSGNVEVGTDEWLEMVNAITDVDSSILDCKTSIEEFDNAILELHTEMFDRVQTQFDNLNSEIEHINGLFDDEDAYDDAANWTDEGITKLGLYAQQYELAKYQAETYAEEIEELNKAYVEGSYSQTEYEDRLAELTEGQWDAIEASEEAKDAIYELNEARVDAAVDALEDAIDDKEDEINDLIDAKEEAIEDEIDAYQDLIDAKKEALEAEQDLHEYRESIADKSKTITDLEKQIAAMENDTTASTQAKLAQLKEELAEAQEELEEEQYDHSIEMQEDALDKSAEDFEEAKNTELEEYTDTLNAELEAFTEAKQAEIDALNATLEDEENLIAESFETVKNNANTVGVQIATTAQEHGVTISTALTTAWAAGEDAIASYGETLTPACSTFVGNLETVENAEWAIKTTADNAADSLASMFATNADNLVSQLEESYDAASNLAAMSEALSNSLIDTLTSAYDVSGIVSSLNSITSAANSAASAVSSVGGVSTDTSTSTDDDWTYAVVDSSGKAVKFGNDVPTALYSALSNSSTSKVNGSDATTWDTIEEAEEFLKKYKSNKLYNGNSSVLGYHATKVKKSYAKGGKNLHEQLAWTQEAGDESILSPTNNAILTPISDGDSVLTSAMTKNLWDWASVNPSNVLSDLSTAPVAAVNNNNNQSINIHYDSLINLSNSEFNDRDGLLEDMTNVAQKAIKQSYTELNKQLKKNGVA